MIHPSVFVQETAVVEAGADIAEGNLYLASRQHPSQRVGWGSHQPGKKVYVDSGAMIGAHCKIQNNVSIYRGVVIKDELFVGPKRRVHQ